MEFRLLTDQGHGKPHLVPILDFYSFKYIQKNLLTGFAKKTERGWNRSQRICHLFFVTFYLNLLRKNL
jgi:hypothetical protein